MVYAATARVKRRCPQQCGQQEEIVCYVLNHYKDGEERFNYTRRQAESPLEEEQEAKKAHRKSGLPDNVLACQN